MSERQIPTSPTLHTFPSADSGSSPEAHCLRLALDSFREENQSASGRAWNDLQPHERRDVEHRAHKLSLVSQVLDAAPSWRRFAESLNPVELRLAARLLREGFTAGIPQVNTRLAAAHERETVAGLLEYIADLKNAASNDPGTY